MLPEAKDGEGGTGQELHIGLTGFPARPDSPRDRAGVGCDSQDLLVRTHEEVSGRGCLEPINAPVELQGPDRGRCRERTGLESRKGQDDEKRPDSITQAYGSSHDRPPQRLMRSYRAQ